MRGLHERPQNKVDVGAIDEFDVVEEVESAARVPGRADEGGLAPGGIRSLSFAPFAQKSGVAGIDDVLVNLDGEETVVHVGEYWVEDTSGERAEGRDEETNAANAPRLTGNMYVINRP